MRRNEQWPRGWNPHVMLGRGVGRWSPARLHDYSVTEQRRRGAGWAIHYLSPEDRTGVLLGFRPTGPEAAEFAMADWDARGAPTQRMRANGYNPWVRELGGDTSFGDLHIGAVFHFPHSESRGATRWQAGRRDSRLTKVSRTTYEDEQGRRWQTGPGAAVVIGELRTNARPRHPSTIDSPAVEGEVVQLADYELGERRGYEDIDCFYEHGQWFVTAWDPHEERQVTYSVVDTSSGLDLEEL